jgi:hypothetical protein
MWQYSTAAKVAALAANRGWILLHNRSSMCSWIPIIKLASYASLLMSDNTGSGFGLECQPSTFRGCVSFGLYVISGSKQQFEVTIGLTCTWKRLHCVPLLLFLLRTVCLHASDGDEAVVSSFLT